MTAWRVVARQLLDNLRALAFVAGFVTLYLGMSGFSRPLANIVTGLILMALGVAPYLVRSRKGG